MSFYTARLLSSPQSSRPLLQAFVVVCVASVFVASGLAQAHRIVGAPPGVVEAGAPPFVILGEEALGLNSPPTDIRRMPDGRVLVVASQQLALGDGVRWEVFRQATDDHLAAGGTLAVDRDGQIYTGISAGFARVDFVENDQWRLAPIASWPRGEPSNRPPLRMHVEVNGDWFWHSGSGALFTWRPGQEARVAGRTEDVETVFLYKSRFYLSDRNDGSLSRLERGASEPVLSADSVSPDAAITCTVPFGEDVLLVGTAGEGLQRFDGETLQPFLAGTVLRGSGRINDVCETAGGMYAAAVENHGIVFFDRQGRIVQSLDRSLDHRLARVKQLLPAPGGVIWALLDHGILRVEFPSRVSFFEPLIGTAVNTAHPYRLDGHLWLLADGKIQRGVYDLDDRLIRLESDTVPNRYVFSFSAAAGIPIAGTERGAYYRSHDGWVPFAPEINNLRVLEAKSRNGRWIYAAKHEMGWLRVTPEGITADRIPAPQLVNAYNAATDKNDNIWIEFGSGKIGRIKTASDVLELESFGTEDGVPQSWAQVFEIDGSVRFNVAEHIIRFDEPSDRFIADTELQSLVPEGGIFGRPGIDSRGRLWLTTTEGVQVFEKRNAGWHRVNEKMSPQFRPYYFTFEENGIVWLHSEHRLERFDPAMPTAALTTMQALVTRVSVATNNRTFYAFDHELPPLQFSENSLLVHFVAIGSPFGAAVTFDVNLEGAGSDWTASGSSGSAVFNRLKEGHYTLRVRPRTADASGTESTLSFAIRPPWYRTNGAYLAYAVLSVGLVLLAGWLFSYLHRRENARLERIVAQRTRELNASNDRLATQVEEIRMLSQAIAQSPVAVFITQPDGTIVFANPRAAELSGYGLNELIGANAAVLRSAPAQGKEMAAEPAIAVGRGESWRGQQINRRKDGQMVHVQSMISPIRSPDGQIRHHLILEEDVTEWLADQEKSRRLEEQLFQAQKLESIGTLAGGIAHDFNNILTGILGYCELARLSAGDDTPLQRDLMEVRSAGLRAKDLVAQILTFSRQSHTSLIPLDIAEPVSEAVKLVRATTPSTIEIVSHVENAVVKADATQIQQVVLNLCTNAVHAMQQGPGRLEISLRKVDVSAALADEIPNLSAGRRVQLMVTDNGHGIEPATLSRIFDPFFTTKRQGEGTGLGLAIVQGIVAAHGAALRVRSVPSSGTAFEIYFPLTSDPVAQPEIGTSVPRGNGQEIMIVDDERSVATFASIRLQQQGYVTTVFTDPAEVIEAFATQPDRYQAIVTDLTMPRLTGADLIQQIRSRGWLIPAVIVTGYGGDALRARLDLLPRCIVIQKPFSGDELARALDLVINDYAVGV
jgi:PAS domain S-box-containing protein